MKRLLFLSLEDWDQVWRRNQIVASLLLDTFSDLEILFVAPPVDLWQGKLPASNAPTAPRKRLHVLKPFKLLPNIIGRQLNNLSLKRQIEGAMNRLGWTDCTIWINNQSMRSCLPAAANRLVYDITDDWSRSSLPPRHVKAVEADDAWLLAHADTVIVCSSRLYELKRKAARKLMLIPNGVDATMFAPQALQASSCPAEMVDIKHPIAGYSGTLHEDRLDVDLIIDTAQRSRHVNFVFIGPNCLSSRSIEKLQEQDNIHLLGMRPYQTLPAFVAQFDLCIAPHKITEFTESLDPIKLYEYASTGKPIIATACAGFRDRKFVRLADRSNFSMQIEDALKENGKNHSEQLEWASNQTWQERIALISQVLGWQQEDRQ